MFPIQSCEIQSFLDAIRLMYSCWSNCQSLESVQNNSSANHPNRPLVHKHVMQSLWHDAPANVVQAMRCNGFVTSRYGDAMRCDASWRHGDAMRCHAMDSCDATRGDATRNQTMRDIGPISGTSPRPWYMRYRAISWQNNCVWKTVFWNGGCIFVPFPNTVFQNIVLRGLY